MPLQLAHLRFKLLTALAGMLLWLAPTTLGAPDGGGDLLGGPPAKKQEEKSPPRRLVIVVHRDNPIRSLKPKEIKRMFLRQKQKWNDGTTIKVFERHSTNTIRGEFINSVLRMKPHETRAYWNNLKLTRGIKPPRVLRSPRLVKQYLKRTKGGVSYLYEDEVDQNDQIVKIVHRIEIRPPDA